MAKESQETVGAQDTQELKERMLEEAAKSPGKTDKTTSIMVREWEKMLKSLRFTEIEELAIGTYFVPHEGQLGIEGIVNGSAALMNQYVQAGWQPWQMATPYERDVSFTLGPEGQTGALRGQWITIIWAKPKELNL